MDWSAHAELSRVWTQASQLYADAVNKYLRKAKLYGAEKAGREPEDPREVLGPAMIEVVREANEAGEAAALREHFWADHHPFIAMMELQGQSLRSVVAIDGERLVVSVGDRWQVGGCRLLHADARPAETLAGVWAVARTPDRSHFALARPDRVDVHQGWQGPVVASWPWPRGNEGIPPTVEAPAAEELIPIEVQLLPDASAAIVSTPEGIFSTSGAGVRRVFPSKEGIAEILEGVLEDGEPSLALDLRMLHAAIDPGGRSLLVGAQSSQHELVTLEGQRLARFGPVGSESPHHARFSPEGQQLWLNSCNFYAGVSVLAETAALEGLDLDPDEAHAALRVVDTRDRIYASVWTQAGPIVGNAWGWLRAFDPQGKPRWEHHIGSTIQSMDLLPDGRQLAVGTAAGFVHLIELDTGERQPLHIGDSTNRECRRWILWRDEPVWAW